jgi:hypothetical protein
MATAVLFGLAALVILIPLSLVATYVMFWWEPHRATMFSALNILVATAGFAALGQFETTLNFDVNFGLIEFKNSSIKIVSGQSTLVVAAVLVAGLTLFAFSAIMRERDSAKMPKVRRKTWPKAAE